MEIYIDDVFQGDNKNVLRNIAVETLIGDGAVCIIFKKRGTLSAKIYTQPADHVREALQDILIFD